MHSMDAKKQRESTLLFVTSVRSYTALKFSTVMLVHRFSNATTPSSENCSQPWSVSASNFLQFKPMASSETSVSFGGDGWGGGAGVQTRKILGDRWTEVLRVQPQMRKRKRALDKPYRKLRLLSAEGIGLEHQHCKNKAHLAPGGLLHLQALLLYFAKSIFFFVDKKHAAPVLSPGGSQ